MTHDYDSVLERVNEAQIMVRDLHLASFTTVQDENGFSFFIDGNIVASFEVVGSANGVVYIILITDETREEEKTFILVDNDYYAEEVQNYLLKLLDQFTGR